MLYAHRGLAANMHPHAAYMENTIPAVRRALRLGCTAVEVDIQLTADMIPILWHDDAIYTRGGVRCDITRTNYADLVKLVKTMTLYRANGKLWEPSKKRVDKLAVLLRKFPHTTFNLELKVSEARKKDINYKYQLVHLVISTIRDVPTTNKIVFSSFDLDVCKILINFFNFAKGQPKQNREQIMVMLLTETDLGQAARLAKSLRLHGVVFDGTKLELNRKTMKGLEWWSYNSVVPLTSASIIDLG